MKSCLTKLNKQDKTSIDFQLEKFTFCARSVTKIQKNKERNFLTVRFSVVWSINEIKINEYEKGVSHKSSSKRRQELNKARLQMRIKRNKTLRNSVLSSKSFRNLSEIQVKTSLTISQLYFQIHRSICLVCGGPKAHYAARSFP